MTRQKKIVLVAVAGLVMAAVAAYGFHVRALRLRFEEKVAAIAARGEPTRLADLVPPAVPDNENAATLYLAAFAHPCFEPDNAVVQRIRRHEAFSGKEREEARRMVERAREPLDLIRRAAARKACRFPRHFASSSNIFERPPELDKLWSAAVLIEAAIRVEAEDGRADEALRDCPALRSLSQVYSQESRGMYVWWMWDAAEYAETVLNTLEPSEASLRALSDALGDVEDLKPLVNALQRERCVQIEICRRWIRNRKGFLRQWNVETLWWTDIPWYAAAGLAWGDAATYLDAMKQSISLAEKPCYARGVTVSSPYGIYLGDDVFVTPPWGTPFSDYAGFPVHQTITHYDRTVARLACLKVALALRLYRLKHGEYPETLDALVPEFIDRLPLDPFSGKDLVYRREGAGFVVYSVDWDGVDDLGVPAEGYQKPGDIALRVSR